MQPFDRRPIIEEWLRSRSAAWAAMTVEEHRLAVAAWRESFEWVIEARAGHLQGRRAYAAVEARLPATLLILGGVRHRLSSTRVEPFGYRIELADALDHGVLNHEDVVLTNDAFSFTCLYTHEAGDLGDAEYYSAERYGTRPPRA